MEKILSISKDLELEFPFETILDKSNGEKVIFPQEYNFNKSLFKNKNQFEFIH